MPGPHEDLTTHDLLVADDGAVAEVVCDLALGELHLTLRCHTPVASIWLGPR